MTGEPRTRAGREYANVLAPITTQSLGAANDAEWAIRQAAWERITAIENEAWGLGWHSALQSFLEFELHPNVRSSIETAIREGQA